MSSSSKPRQTDFLDILIAEAAKREGMERVKINAADWMPIAFARAINWCRANLGAEITGEDLRFTLTEAGLQDPHHPNAWGQLTKQVLEAGWLWHTGYWRKPRSRASHARPTKIYRVI